MFFNKIKTGNVSRRRFDKQMSQSIHLKQCPKCRNSGEIVVKMPMYGVTGAMVKCPICGYKTKVHQIHTMFNTKGTLGTPIVPQTMLSGILEAIEEWEMN